MNLLLAFVIGQVVSPAEAATARVDAEAAIRLAKQSATALGVPEPSLDEISLMKNNLNGPIPFWGVGFVASDQRKGSVLIDSADGRVVYASFAPPVWTWGDAVIKLADVERQARKFVGAVGYQKNLKLRSCDLGEKGLAHAAFDILANGRRFFNSNPAFQYTMLFYPRQKSIYVFTAFDHLPPVSKDPVVLTKQQAVEAFKKYVPTTEEFQRCAKPDSYMQAPTFSVDLELGYYLFKDERTARSVWSGVATIYRRTPNTQLEMGRVPAVIDARTGVVSPIQDGDATPTS